MKTTINKDAIRHEITYSWWKYLLLIVISLFGWNLFYTTTAYRSPDYLKVELYANGMVNAQTMSDYMEKVRQEEMSDMEVMSAIALTSDDYYGTMQISTYIMAAEGDLYLLPADMFKSYASSGAFVALEDDEELIALAEANGCALDRGWRNLEDDGVVVEKHLYGIPASTISGLRALDVVPDDRYFAVLYSGGNVENTIKFLKILLRDMIPATTTDIP